MRHYTRFDADKLCFYFSCLPLHLPSLATPPSTLVRWQPLVHMECCTEWTHSTATKSHTPEEIGCKQYNPSDFFSAPPSIFTTFCLILVHPKPCKIWPISWPFRPITTLFRLQTHYWCHWPDKKRFYNFHISKKCFSGPRTQAFDENYSNIMSRLLS